MKDLRPAGLGRALFATCAAAALALSAAAQTPSFQKGLLAGAAPNDPTSLAFGPDGRLYVAERFGVVRVYTIERLGIADYVVTATETLNHVYAKPNRRDDGTLDPATQGRQCTGLLVAGTAQNPVVYVTSSDPRVAVGNDSGLDTNSGLLTRLTWNGVAWEELDLVRGLPRCEENHASNGMALDPATNTLYLAQGGNTNMGAPSNNFGMTPEYALSAAILSVDLDAIGDTTYDLPTLDDPSRPNSGPGGADEFDPFGGNDGANQAVIVAGGPVQVYAPGFRNAYDVLIHSDGWLYTVDNGPNTGWGGPPLACTNDPNEAGSGHDPDGLHRIGVLGDGGGYYGGHPNPWRASSANTVNGQSPIPPGADNPIECQYLEPGVDDGALVTWNTSTNGLCEYTAGNFGGAMQGDLLTVGYGSKKVERVQLQADGTLAGSSTLLSSVATQPLDIVAQGDTESFPGTLWIAAFGNDSIVVFEPDDLALCSGSDDPVLDDDGDGYTNADEIDNGTDPCSAGDVPPDFDGDLVSDLNDPDDDGDGLGDTVDPFAIDAANGLATPAPLHYGWGVGDPGHGFFGVGFTGLMTNGLDDYLTLFSSEDVIAGGAAGKFTVDHVGPGDALGAQNDQDAAFQLGVDTAGLGPFTVRTALEAPLFGGLTPIDGQSLGLFLGDGGQDDYVAVALGAGGGSGALEVVVEEGGIVLEESQQPAAVLGALSIELSLAVDPVAGTVQPAFRADDGPLQLLGGPRAVPSSLLDAVGGATPLAVGVLATAGPTGPSYAATWDFLEVTQDSTARATVSLGPVGGAIGASTDASGAFRIENASPDGQAIATVVLDLSTALLGDLVFDPDGTAGDSAAKAFTADSGDVETGLVGFSYAGDHDGGYDRLTITFDDFQPGEVFAFSADVDPTSIQGAAAPGPSGAGNVSGLELTGAVVTVGFDDGSAVAAQAWRAPGSQSEATAVVRTGLPVRPELEVAGLPGSALVLPATSQTVRIAAPVGADVRLLVAEAGLHVAGVPGGGFDVDPFEANSVVAVQEFAGTVGAGGAFEAAVDFTPTDGDAGLFRLTAVVVDGDGATSLASTTVAAELAPAALVAPPLDFGPVLVGASEALGVAVTNGGASPATLTGLELLGDAAFSLGATPALPLELAQGESAVVEIAFVPGLVGAVGGTLIVHHDGDDGPLAVDLAGEGLAPDFEVLYRVNCGGPEVAALDGTQPWTADTAAAPSPWVNAAETNKTSTGVAVTPHASAPAQAPDVVYETERWDASGGANMRWEFPVPAGTLVEVRLLVAENFAQITGPGQRVFDAFVEGRPVLGIDPFAEAGFGVGYARSVVVSVPDGVLDVDFFHGVENPSLKAIEVRRPGTLVSSRPLISATTGGTQELFLSAGPKFGGDTYIVLSSLSGSSPGLPLGNVLVPLVFDSMTVVSIESANSGPYVDSLGVLDAEGRAEAAFAVPSGLPPALVGVELTHAGVLFEGATVLAASQAVTLTLTE